MCSQKGANTSMKRKQRHSKNSFLVYKQNCFARPGEVGRTNLGYHEIKLHDEKPIREPPKRVPLHKRQALEEEIKKLEKQNLIV